MAKTKGRTTAALRKPGEHGINLDVPGTALAAQAAERIEWHNRTIAALSEELKGIPAKDSADLTTADDWRRDARRREIARQLLGHQEYARFLSFLQRHLEPRRVYRLSLTDLSALEIMPTIPRS
jgi:hypothetical protein